MNHQILTFFIVSLFLVISPGPNMALIIDNASRLGKKNSLANVAGLCTATYIHGALSILGISAIVLNNALLFLTVKTLGAAYLLYMGLKSLKSGFQGIRTQQTATIMQSETSEKTRLSSSYIDGFMTQILNPKVSVFYIAAFPKFLADGGGIKKGYELVTIHSFNIFAWFTLLTVFISFSSVALRKPIVRGWINMATGLVLALFAVFIFVG